MQVKNYIVDNYQVLINCLEEELCKNGIFYVRIDNEIHFQDKIIRFYDIEVDKKETLYYHMNKSKQKQNSHKVKQQIKRYSR